MIVENLQSIRPFTDWLFNLEIDDLSPDALTSIGAFWLLLIILLLLFIAFSFFGWLFASMRHGPTEGLNVAGRVLIDSFWDVVKMSPRRVWAITWLAIAEARRRYVIVIFAIFMVIMLFAGWYLDAESDKPAEVYLTFVLTSSSMLAIMLGLMLSAFSLPEDLENKTIYTVVTKPVRSSELIVGRICGFMIVGTVLLLVMGVSSYIFVNRGLSHAHTVAEQTPGEIEAEVTTESNRHIHKVLRNGDLITIEHAAGHTHAVEVQGDELSLGRPQGQLQARVPVYGTVKYYDRNGKENDGINVGDEWDYRKYIEGASDAAVKFTYRGVTPERFAAPLTSEETAALKKSRSERSPKEQQLAQSAQRKQGLPLELDIGVFRTYKGDIVTRVRGQVVVRNPSTAKNIESTPQIFQSQEFSKQQITIPRKLRRLNPITGELEELDLFEDFVENGEVEIIISCLDRGQYFGMGQYDVYLRAADSPFWVNLLAGFVSIWLQLLLVVCFGVMFSTFLRGSVALMATIGAVFIGYYSSFVTSLLKDLLNPDVSFTGGGPIEATIRMFTQENVTTQMNIPGISVIQWIDKALVVILYLVTYLLPPFRNFNTSRLVAEGYAIGGNLIAQHLLIGIAFTLVLTAIGYVFFKTREIAA